MKKKTIGSVLACLVLIMAFNVETGITQGRSPSSPAPIATSVVTMIECGEGYTSNELYDMTITVTEVVRGQKASGWIGGAPEAGSEYILARIRVEYLARGLPGKCSHELRPEQFTALSGTAENTRLLLCGCRSQRWVAVSIPGSLWKAGWPSRWLKMTVSRS